MRVFYEIVCGERMYDERLYRYPFDRDSILRETLAQKLA